MASKEQKKQQKQKERKIRVRKKVLAQREELRSPEREKREMRKTAKRVDRLKKDLGYKNIWDDEVLLGLNSKTLTQLEKNALILKALEEEYEKEHMQRSKINQELEDKGLYTLQDKLNYLHEELAEEQRQQNPEDILEFGEEPSVTEVAEVEVIKASQPES